MLGCLSLVLLATGAFSTLRAAPGDVTGVTVSNGWMYVTLDGMVAGGTYRLGIDNALALHAPTNPAVVLRG